MIIVSATVRIRPDKIEAYEAAFRQIAAQAKVSEPDLLLYEIARDPKAPNTYRVFEGYADKAAMQAHIDSDLLPSFRDSIMACLAEEPKIEIFQTVD